jgi:hypothetical protein
VQTEVASAGYTAMKVKHPTFPLILPTKSLSSRWYPS